MGVESHKTFRYAFPFLEINVFVTGRALFGHPKLEYER